MSELKSFLLLNKTTLYSGTDFISRSVDGHLECLYFWTVVDNVGMDVHLQDF